MKKKLMVLSTSILATVFLFGCSAPEEFSQSAGNVEPPDVASSSEQSTATSVISSSEVLPSNLYEEELTEYLHLLVKSVNEPINSQDDLKKLDLFNLLVFEAEEYAQKQGKSYAAKDAPDSAYWFPKQDLQDLSVRLFGFEIDFGPYEDGTYFINHGYSSNYYDSDRDEFFIVIVSAPEPAARSNYVSLKELLSYKSSVSEIEVICKLTYAKDLGDSGIDKTATYAFEVVQDDNLTYFRLKSVVFT